MPLKELIPDPNDRHFNTSIGNWTGFDHWNPGPYQGRTGLGVIVWPAGLSSKDVFLHYPYCKPPPNKTVVFDQASLILAPGGIFFLFTSCLSDGFHVLTGVDAGYEDPLGWSHPRSHFTTPPDWNTPTSFLKINYLKDDPSSWQAYFDDNTLYYTVEGRSDHLPLMGVH